MQRHIKHSESGSIIVSVLLMTLFLTTLVYSLIVLANANMARARARILILQAQYAAESGADAAIATLNNTNSSYTGTGASEVVVLNNGRYKATYVTTVANGSNTNERIVTATGKLYEPANTATPKYQRSIEIKASRSTTTTTSAMVSRNVINIQSGVKNLTAVDVTLNGYILMNKNTTNLIAENITVGGRMTGAGNCSIAGAGNLLKPAAFTHGGQTKTNIVMAYNNCITPPGNTSNTNFNISANNSNIQPIQSTFIPWSQYMDSNYLAASSGCNDWTTGAFPRTIPSTAKRSHYPDSGNGVAASCGTNGDLSLGTGQYNITDNVHIRANICPDTTNCNPVFYNPTSNIKYIFVEGTVGFDGVKTAAGSGPIAIISYGSDPASRTSVCPEGGAVYIGNGETDAPDLYLLATNGLCLDKTKFTSAKALGGLSGKNLYISSSPGTVFDLALDETFPTASIPVNLAWKATQYRRL